MTEDQNANDGDSAAESCDASEDRVDELRAVRAAKEAVRRARERLRRAELECEEVRRRASEARDEPPGGDVDLVETTLNLVRRHPGAGVLTAALCGFFVGKLFRR